MAAAQDAAASAAAAMSAYGASEAARRAQKLPPPPPRPPLHLQPDVTAFWEAGGGESGGESDRKEEKPVLLVSRAPVRLASSRDLSYLYFVSLCLCVFVPSY